MKTVLIATDGSAASREAVEFGVERAEEEKATVVFAHALSLLEVSPDGHTGVPHRPVRAEDDEALAEAVELATRKGVPCKTELLVGLPEDELVALADSVDADLIVVGSRQLGRVKRAMLGSVSQAVLEKTSRPVLLVRASREPAVTV